MNDAVAKGRYAGVQKMDFEAPLTMLVWLTSIVSVVLTYVAQLPDDPDARRRHHAVVEAVHGDHLRHAGRRDHPRVVKVFTSTNSSHVREVVTSSREGGASLNILSGLVAGNFSAYWLGLAIMGSDDDRLLRVGVRPRLR